MSQPTYTIKLESRPSDTQEDNEVLLQVIDSAGNIECEALYNEEVYLEDWKIKLLEHVAEYTSMYLAG